MRHDDEFFIGYAPPVPPHLARFIRRIVLAIGGALAIWTIALAAGHVRLDGGTFEFGHPGRVSGRIVERPYPALEAEADGPPQPAMLLVAPGKHGADDLVRGLDGRLVTLTGTRIQRGTHTMLEIEPASLEGVRPAAGSASADARQRVPGAERRVVVTGEIVDSKCFLGVMVPGAGKTHKDCASLCLRGGIAPALHVQDPAGRSELFLLTGPSGESIRDAAVRAAGEPIVVSGTAATAHGWSVLRTDPHTWRRPGSPDERP